jgi:hypothetical protein
MGWMRCLPIAFIGLLPMAVGAQTAFTCPSTVSLASPALAASSVVAPFDGSVSNQPLHLTGVQLFDGPPEQGAALRPQSSKLQRGQEQAEWRFQGDFAAGKWFACSYAQGLALLSTRLPDGVLVCTSQTRAGAIKGRLAVSLKCS